MDSKKTIKYLMLKQIYTITKKWVVLKYIMSCKINKQPGYSMEKKLK